MLKFLDFSLRPGVKHFADRRAAVLPCCEKLPGKPDVGWLIRECEVIYILEKSSDCMNCIFFSVPGSALKENQP